MADSDPELLDVRILAFPTTLKESPVIGLKRVFGIDEVAASRLIGNLPAVVQRGVPRVRAEYFRRALVLIGAEVEVRTRAGELVHAPAPVQTEAAPPREAAPAQRDTSRTRVAPVEPEPEPVPVPDAAPARAAPRGDAATPDPASPHWGNLELGPAPRPDEPAALDLLSFEHPRAPPAPELMLPDPPPAVRERRPNARILPGEVPPSNPPRAATTRSSRPPRAMAARRNPASHRPPPPPAAIFDTRSFWSGLGDALALPWLGRGPYWLLALFVWSIFTALLSIIAHGLAVPALPLVIGALGALSLMGFAADGFRAAFRSVADGAPAIAQAPEFDPALIATRYVLSALHLMLFALVTNVPVLLWYFKQAEGAPLWNTLTHPMTWLLAAFPFFYWPAGLATAALHGNFAGVWKVHVGLRAVVMAPTEYLASATLGALAFGLTCAAFAGLGSLLELPPALGLAALGLPLGLSHLLWGSLLGHLQRARPEAFEP